MFVFFPTIFIMCRSPGVAGSGTLRPKTISARDSSAQIDFLLGLLGPGLLGPVIKILFLWHTMENKCISSVFYFNIRFSTIGKRNVKRESMFSYKQMYFLFHVGHPSRPRTLRPIFTTIDF